VSSREIGCRTQKCTHFRKIPKNILNLLVSSTCLSSSCVSADDIMLDSVDAVLAVLAVLEPLGESCEESSGGVMARTGEAKSLPSSRDAGLEVIYGGHLRHRVYLRVLGYRDRR
jgi:hypothetical protein